MASSTAAQHVIVENDGEDDDIFLDPFEFSSPIHFLLLIPLMWIIISFLYFWTILMQGFDWDAAVRAIDVACEASASASAAKPADSTSTSTDPFRTPCFGVLLPPKLPRQAKLDKFFGRTSLRNAAGDFVGVAVPGGVEGIGIQGKSGAVEIDAKAAKTWVYPGVNVPLRDHQLSITKTALFSNKLVALTGLGKTLIAAVVMYNYFR